MKKANISNLIRRPRELKNPEGGRPEQSTWRTPSSSVSTRPPTQHAKGSRLILSARGKTQELRDELRGANDKRDKGFLRKKTALKKIVANMTMGNDSE